ncbi:hypothetical protein [Lacipirellula sp.]|uniref:hypothetical protein n=1 Tax=Lacipirellula sp. TaxID=2691419 RepID=UPI003D0DB3CB
MSEAAETPSDIILKWIAKPFVVPKRVVQSGSVAMLSVVQTLLEMVDSHLATDIQRLKEANLRIIEADARLRGAQADEKAAEARKKLSEAIAAANKNALTAHREALRLVERQAAVEQTNANTRAINSDAMARQCKMMAEAQAELLDAVSRLRQEGGDLLLDRRNLNKLLRDLKPGGSDGELRH